MTYRRRSKGILAAALLLAACIEFKDDDAAKKAADTTAAGQPAVTDASDVTFPSYAEYALDTVGVGARYAASPADDSLYSQISERSASAAITRFPLRIPRRGPAALQIQVLLDRAHFSPGIIDGMWGDNAVKALAYFKSPSDSSGATGLADSVTMLDQATYARLRSAGGTKPVLTNYTVTAEDVKGPFTSIPNDVYEQAKLQCLCYADAAEGIAEKFHTSRRLLAQLNPGANLENLTAGTSLVVPNVEPALVSSGSVSTADNDSTAATGAGGVARLIISSKGFWTHAVDATGKILAHYPSTLGAGYDPSPTGDFRVTNIAWNPAFHYQPTLFAEVSDKKPEAHLPKGPNSPVGVVWMALSKPHYGIHGTSTPETIGYANSHGCVRLTNWDAIELGKMISKGTPVVFE